jgi:hypothetical protein
VMFSAVIPFDAPQMFTINSELNLYRW